MLESLFSEKEFEQIKSYGINLEEVKKHIDYFTDGFPFCDIIRHCSLNDGICKINEDEFQDLSEVYAKAEEESRVLKFVPASGAATRMFKYLIPFNELESINLDEIKSRLDEKDCQEIYKFITDMNRFAFYDDLVAVLKENNIDINEEITKGDYKNIIDYLLTDKGLNYANLPKGLLKFHKYPEHDRTAFEEHLVEGANYIKDKDNNVKLHFTISPEHKENVIKHFNEVKPRYEDQFNVKFDISYSVQKNSTDTIAVDSDNKPFRDKNGKLLFRPGGHGALIENLDDLKADIIFIKNIDNVVPDKLKEETYKYKRALGGYLISLQNKIFSYLRQLEAKNVSEELIKEIFSFMSKKLFVDPTAEVLESDLDKKINFAFEILDRPIRVCGMVKNVGEPGGGPFWVKHKDGTVSLQIVETSQINIKDCNQKDILTNSTHFNPVDLICGVRDYKGNNYNLRDFIDHTTGFISSKTKDGRDIKALELPGLWNGAMAEWNTLFIEVPIITFNPVKTVNDLLRPEHQ